MRAALYGKICLRVGRQACSLLLRIRGQSHGCFGGLVFIPARVQRNLFDHLAVAVTGVKIHLRVQSHRILAQNAFYPADGLKEGFPILL